jgi:hypothetical protein
MVQQAGGEEHMQQAGGEEREMGSSSSSGGSGGSGGSGSGGSGSGSSGSGGSGSSGSGGSSSSSRSEYGATIGIRKQLHPDRQGRSLEGAGESAQEGATESSDSRTELTFEAVEIAVVRIQEEHLLGDTF